MTEQGNNPINECISDYVQSECSPSLQPSKLLRTLLEFWALEKDYELKSDLLNSMVVKHALLMKNLVDLNHLKNKFLGIAAHDLRNPLISIRGLSEIILSEATGPLTSEQREYLGIVHSVSDGMLNLVNNLLDVSVIESGGLELQRGWGSIRELVEERIRIHKVMAAEKGIMLHAMLSEFDREHFFDAGKIAQVIDNLLSNAIKFSPHNTNVFIGLEKNGDEVTVSIRDEGPGIPEEDQSRIFGEFQVSTPMPTGGEKSTGLGLAIAKRIVEAHDGVMGVRSRPGKGSLFHFTIPAGCDNDWNATPQSTDR
jgi:two-component system, sensor histidine kinase and response regulator